MKRMHDNKNLRTSTPEEARRNGALGGKKSVEARRRKKLLRECIEELLEREYDTAQGKMLGAEALAVQLMKKALSGDIKAFEVLRDTAGQKPVERVKMQTDVNIADSAERLSNIFEQIREEK